MTRIAPIICLFAALIALSSASSDKAKSDSCPFKCHHGSDCVKGEADFGILAELNPNLESKKHGHHCDCTTGEHTGLQCETEFEHCDKHTYCFNGGSCATTDDGGVGCDCSTVNGPFAGKFCENQATEVCDDQHFCTNGGSCHEKDGKMKCKCPDEFHGSKCQFAKADTASVLKDISSTATGVAKASAKSKNTGTKQKMSGAAIFFIVAVAVLSVVIVAAIIIRRKRSFKVKEEPVNLSPVKTEGDDGEFHEVHMI